MHTPSVRSDPGSSNSTVTTYMLNMSSNDTELQEVDTSISTENVSLVQVDQEGNTSINSTINQAHKMILRLLFACLQKDLKKVLFLVM